jgi:hypothetical protein
MGVGIAALRTEVRIMKWSRLALVSLALFVLEAPVRAQGLLWSQALPERGTALDLDGRLLLVGFGRNPSPPLPGSTLPGIGGVCVAGGQWR